MQISCFAPLHLRSFLALSILLVPIAAASAQTAAPSAAQTGSPEVKNIFWQPDQVVQGSPVLITVELSGPAERVSGTWIGKRLLFFKSDKPREWYALAGADLNTKPDNYDLRVTAVMAGGHAAHAAKSVAVEAGNFGNGTANVAEQYVHPNAEELKAIEHDELLKKRAFAHDTPRPLWSGNFTKPVDAASTPSFGETRVLNGEKTSVHDGTDFPLKEGSPVHAANSGVVVLASHLYYEGECVIIDHGDRLFTVYMHLSKINVHADERVRKGELLGLSGATGRVTAPHFHFGVVWSGARLDPLQMLSLTLPDRPSAAR